jgi:hypothetical protein
MHARENRRTLGGQQMAERPERHGQIEFRTEGKVPHVGPDQFGVRMRFARLREHSGAEVDSGYPPLAYGRERAHSRAGAAAHVQSPLERPERTQRVGGRVENAVGRPERRVVELRREQVVPPLDRGQRLHRQLPQRRPLRREHRPRLLAAGHRGAAASRSPTPPDMIVRTWSVMCRSGQSHQARARRRSMSASE